MLRLSGRFLGQSDYTTTEDYDPPDADWRDCTILGSVFQVEVDVRRSGHFRQRNAKRQEAWKKGKPDE
jgi:hypothetical protein